MANAISPRHHQFQEINKETNRTSPLHKSTTCSGGFTQDNRKSSPTLGRSVWAKGDLSLKAVSQVTSLVVGCH